LITEQQLEKLKSLLNEYPDFTILTTLYEIPYKQVTEYAFVVKDKIIFEKLLNQSKINNFIKVDDCYYLYEKR